MCLPLTQPQPCPCRWVGLTQFVAPCLPPCAASAHRLCPCPKHLAVTCCCPPHLLLLWVLCQGFAAIKMTALGNTRLLKRVSDALTMVRGLFKTFDTDNSRFVDKQVCAAWLMWLLLVLVWPLGHCGAGLLRCCSSVIPAVVSCRCCPYGML